MERKHWGLRGHARLSGFSKIKNNEPVKRNVDFLSLIGGGVSSQLIQECFCSILVLGILPTVSCNTVHRSQVMPTQQIFTFRHCSFQTTPRDANNLKIHCCATVPTNFDAARIELEAFDTGSIGSLPTLAEAVQEYCRFNIVRIASDRFN